VLLAVNVADSRLSPALRSILSYRKQAITYSGVRVMPFRRTFM